MTKVKPRPATRLNDGYWPMRPMTHRGIQRQLMDLGRHALGCIVASKAERGAGDGSWPTRLASIIDLRLLASRFPSQPLMRRGSSPRALPLRRLSMRIKRHEQASERGVRRKRNATPGTTRGAPDGRTRVGISGMPLRTSVLITRDVRGHRRRSPSMDVRARGVGHQRRLPSVDVST